MLKWNTKEIKRGYHYDVVVMKRSIELFEYRKIVIELIVIPLIS